MKGFLRSVWKAGRGCVAWEGPVSPSSAFSHLPSPLLLPFFQSYFCGRKCTGRAQKELKTPHSHTCFTSRAFLVRGKWWYPLHVCVSCVHMCVCVLCAHVCADVEVSMCSALSRSILSLWHGVPESGARLTASKLQKPSCLWSPTALELQAWYSHAGFLCGFWDQDSSLPSFACSAGCLLHGESPWPLSWSLSVSKLVVWNPNVTERGGKKIPGTLPVGGREEEEI